MTRNYCDHCNVEITDKTRPFFTLVEKKPRVPRVKELAK